MVVDLQPSTSSEIHKITNSNECANEILKLEVSYPEFSRKNEWTLNYYFQMTLRERSTRGYANELEERVAKMDLQKKLRILKGVHPQMIAIEEYIDKVAQWRSHPDPYVRNFEFRQAQSSIFGLKALNFRSELKRMTSLMM